MAKKRKTKAAPRRRRRRPKLAVRRSSRRRYRSSTLHRSKVASHGPADVEGASKIARDAPAQVRQQRASARRRLEFLTIVRVAFGSGVERRVTRFSHGSPPKAAVSRRI